MSGWIRFDKTLPESMRFRRVVKAITDSNALRSVTEVSNVRDSFAVTAVLGALMRLWSYADTHVRNDNTLAIKIEEIDELVGIQGFAKALPADWLKIIDAENVQLPDFLSHNGSSEKLRRDNARRQAAFRHRHGSSESNALLTANNVSNDARPDQTRPDQTREESKTVLSAAPTSGAKARKVSRDDCPGWWADFRNAYPPRAGDQNWRGALRSAHARITEGHKPDEFIAGAKRYAAYVLATGRAKTEFVKQASTFLGPGKPFLDPWDIPRSAAQSRQDSSVDAAKQWLESSDAG